MIVIVLELWRYLNWIITSITRIHSPYCELNSFSWGACGSIVGWGTIATSRKVEGSIPSEIIGFFSWPNPYIRSMALGVKGRRRVRVTTSPTSVSQFSGRCGSLHGLIQRWLYLYLIPFTKIPAYWDVWCSGVIPRYISVKTFSPCSSLL
jgi:hypothetical protein